MAYTWALPSLMPVMLPWLALLALMVAAPNRHAQAWWIWVPLLGALAVGFCVSNVLEFIPAMPRDQLGEMFHALAFGVAAVWLSAWLGRPPRFVGFLGLLVTLGVFSMLTYATRQVWSEIEWEPVLITLGIAVGALAVGLALGGLMCRRRYRPTKFFLWLMVWVILAWCLCTTPFLFLVMASTGGSLEQVLQFQLIVLTLAGATMLTVLPFLVLSFTNSFFGERLKQVLRLEVTPP